MIRYRVLCFLTAGRSGLLTSPSIRNTPIQELPEGFRRLSILVSAVIFEVLAFQCSDLSRDLD